jgi:hypothetical protein
VVLGEPPDQLELQYLRVLAEIGLPQRWAALVARGRAELPESGTLRLDDVCARLAEIGFAFTPKEYDDEDYWPVYRVEKHTDHSAVLAISSNDPSGVAARQITFSIALSVPGHVMLGDGWMAWVIGEIQRYVTSPGLAAPAGYRFVTWEELQVAINWFRELADDVTARTRQLTWDST